MKTEEILIATLCAAVAVALFALQYRLFYRPMFGG